MTTTYQYQHKLAYFLELNYLEYEHLQDLYFQKWCYANARLKCWNYEAMIVSDCLRNWFAKQWETHVENELQRCYDDYLNEGVMTADDLHEVIFTLFKAILWIYPHVLIKEINKKSITI